MTMTDTTFPFNDALDETAEPPRSRRTLMLAGGLAAVVLLGGGYLLLGGGGTAVTFVPRARPAVLAPKAAAALPAKAPAKVPVASTEHLGRDPFKALYVQPAAPVAAPAAAPAPAPAAAPVGTGPAAGTTGTAPTATSPATAAYALELVSISKPNPETRFYSFKVAGVAKTVIPAQRFGSYGELIVLGYTKNATGTVTGALIQVGDDSPRDVRLGETVKVL